MTFFETPFAHVFDKVWRLHCKPKCSVIEPADNWTLDSGVEYDAHQDQFIDEDGEPITVDWTEQPAEEIAFIPAKQSNNVALSIPGVVTTTTSERNIVLQWSSDTQTRIAAAWGVAIGSQLYRVKEWVLVPEGVTTPLEIRVSLVEA